MKENARRIRRPTKHVEILAVLHVVYGGFHFLAFGPMFALSLGVLLTQGQRAWENEFVSDGITACVIGIPTLVGMPFAAAYFLSQRRRCAKVFVALSAVFALALALFLAYISLAESEAGWAIYFAPCLALSGYSLWFVCRRPFL
ncbi:MAG TPA: hypothetical protein VF064_19670 [Pyrinomonadaceae bacterium]